MYPVKCTGTIALVFGVIACSIRSTFIQKVSSTSTNIGTAPISAIAPTVATKVFAAVMTSSPTPTPSARSAIFIASVPLFTPIACLVPIKDEKLSSNSYNGLPRVKSPVFTNFFNSSQSSGQSSNC